MQPEWSPEEEQEARRLAQAVVERGLAMPAVLFLESVRPLHFIGSQFLHFLAPLGGIVVRRWDLDRMGNFFEHRGAVAFVVSEIQRLDEEKRRRARPPSDADTPADETASSSRPPGPTPPRRAS